MKSSLPSSLPTPPSLLLYQCFLFLFEGHLSLAIILLVLVAKCIATTWIDKCYCPGKDPILNILGMGKAKDLRNKMYELKSAHTSKKLNIWWRKCKFMQRMNNST